MNKQVSEPFRSIINAVAHQGLAEVAAKRDADVAEWKALDARRDSLTDEEFDRWNDLYRTGKYAEQREREDEGRKLRIVK